jgi:hypothetical protein
MDWGGGEGYIWVQNPGLKNAKEIDDRRLAFSHSARCLGTRILLPQAVSFNIVPSQITIIL